MSSTTKLSSAQLRAFVNEKVSVSIMTKVVKYVVEHGQSYWGEDKPDNFVVDLLYMVIMKDLTSFGYKKMCDQVNLGYHINHESLQHNTEIMRRLLADWAATQLDLGNRDIWKAHSRHFTTKKTFKECSLWIDSSDFPLAGKRVISRKSKMWSYKLNKPGQRFMFIVDGKGIVRKVWGGYSPKEYDSMFVESHKDEFTSLFHGVSILADNHFKSANKKVHGVKFMCNLRRTKVDQETKEDKDQPECFDTELEFLSKAQWNTDHSHARARVEQIFGYMKNKFTALKLPWQEDPKQQEYLVMFATAIFSIVSSMR